MKLLYFAWLRERIGVSEEVLALPANVGTVEELIEHLKTKGDGYANAFRDISAVKVAINQDFARLDTGLSDSDEVAFFPPVTGGAR